jgi:hypothetical protein
LLRFIFYYNGKTKKEILMQIDERITRLAENIILGFGASRAKAEAVGEIVKLFAGHMSRRESRLTHGAARHSPRLHQKIE